MATYSPTGGQTYTLGASISSTQDTILLSSFLEPISGVPYTMALINSTIVYGTIAPKTTQSEFISFTGITQNADGTATLTGVVRGLSRSSPFTSSTTFKLPHSGQTTFILSNSPEQINEYGVKRNDETITGYWKAPDPVGLTDIANKQWVLSVVNGGSISINQVIVGGSAGETVTAGNLVYLKSADGLWWKTDADTTATIQNVQLGIAQGAGTAGAVITGGVLIEGVDTHNTGTAGAYGYASNTAGVIGTVSGTTEKVVGQFVVNLGGFYFNPNFYYILTAADKTALAALTATPTVKQYGTYYGDETTQFDVTNPSGTTFRYTYDGNGTNPGITTTSFPTGNKVIIKTFSTQLASGNQGQFTITGSGTNFFEVTNASGVAESNKILSGGYLLNYLPTWTKPVGLKYVNVRLVGAGGNGAAGTDSGDFSGAAGGAGGYSEKNIVAASLGATETVTLAISGSTTSFGSHLQATSGSNASGSVPGVGGVGSLGTFNNVGQGGGSAPASAVFNGGTGGSTPLGGGGSPVNGTLTYNAGFGGGGAGGEESSSQPGGIGGPGTVIVTEYYI